MRARKVVVCVSSDEVRLSLRMVLVDTWGYKAVRAESVPAAVKLIETRRPHVLVLDLPVKGDCEDLLEKARAVDLKTAILVVSHRRTVDKNSPAHVYLIQGGDSPGEIRDRLQTLAARKRGPKPGRRSNKQVSMEAA